MKKLMSVLIAVIFVAGFALAQNPPAKKQVKPKTEHKTTATTHHHMASSTAKADSTAKKKPEMKKK